VWKQLTTTYFCSPCIVSEEADFEDRLYIISIGTFLWARSHILADVKWPGNLIF